MQERSIKVNVATIVAATIGTASLVCLVANFFVAGEALGFVGLWLAIVAALFRVRSWFVRLNARETNAYLLGQESVRNLKRVP
jgi:hypothetical protein